MLSTSPGTRFVEYRYCHHPKTEKADERTFFRKMHHLHRAFRDPTYNKPLPENMTDFSQLYIFPYSSHVLRNAEENWEMIVPGPIVEDINRFFGELYNKGSTIAFLQCQDGEHVEFTLSQKKQFLS